MSSTIVGTETGLKLGGVAKAGEEKELQQRDLERLKMEIENSAWENWKIQPGKMQAITSGGRTVSDTKNGEI